MSYLGSTPPQASTKHAVCWGQAHRRVQLGFRALALLHLRKAERGRRPDLTPALLPPPPAPCPHPNLSFSLHCCEMGAGLQTVPHESLQETKRTAPRGRQAQPRCRPEPVLCPEQCDPPFLEHVWLTLCSGTSLPAPASQTQSRGRGSAGPRPTARPASSQTPWAIQGHTPSPGQASNRNRAPQGPMGGAPEALFTGNPRAGRGEGERQRDGDQAGLAQRGVGRGVDPRTDTSQGRGEAKRAWRWGGTDPVRDPRGLPAPTAGGASPHPHVPLFRLGTAAPGHCPPKRRGPVQVPPSWGWLPRQKEHPAWPRTLPVLKALQTWGAAPVQGQLTTEGRG